MPKKADEADQARRFAEAARAAGAEANAEAFRARLRIIGRQEPKPVPEPPAERLPRPAQAARPVRTPEDSLPMAERHVAWDEARLARQEEIVAEMDIDHHPAAAAPAHGTCSSTT